MTANKNADLAGPGISTYKEVEKVLPKNYKSLLTPKETQKAIFTAKNYIEEHLGKELNLRMVTVPLIVDKEKRKNQKTLHQCQCARCRKQARSAEAKEHRAINQFIGLLHEKGRRQFVGLLALQWGRGSIQRLSTITGLSAQLFGVVGMRCSERNAQRSAVEYASEALDGNWLKKTARDLD